MAWTQSAALRRFWWLIVSAAAVGVIVPFLFFSSRPFQQIHGWLVADTDAEDQSVLPAAPRSEFYEWDTKSQFTPVRFEHVANRSIEELCNAFPQHLLRDIQPVLKTGHGVVDVRVRPHLHSVSACLSHLLIFSDVDEKCEGRDIIDVIADLPAAAIERSDQLKTYRILQEFAANGSLADANETAREGWRMDKFKFLPGVSRAWRMRPERRWYIFYEADTYIVWDNMFRLLENFDADSPLYFGSPTPGRNGTWFGNGGPGYILSREAMRRLVEDDWDHETGEYLGTRLTANYWDTLIHDCCGDSVLGWALSNKNVSLGGLWPSFSPHPPHGTPFSDLYWCQPILTMHKPSEEDIMHLWRWQWEHRQWEVSCARRRRVEFLKILSWS